MAVLVPPEGEAPAVLGARHMVGRSPGAHTRIPSRAVSGEHAVFLWTGERWSVRDLGSKNGTWVGDRQLAPGETVSLPSGSEIAFGEPENRWTLVSDFGPTVAAYHGREILEGEGRLLALPDEDDPEVVIELDPAYGWQAIRDGEALGVVDGEEVEAGGHTWTICLPNTLLPAPLTTELQEISITEKTIGRTSLDFAVSADEEYIELTAKVSGISHLLPPRVHHYLLLTLARTRLTDAAEGIAESEQGWMYTSALRKALRISPNQYYVMTHRLRRELEDLGVVDATRLVEKRTTSRQVRIGVSQLTVRPL